MLAAAEKLSIMEILIRRMVISLDAGKQTLHEERRQERAADVEIQFLGDGVHFNVLSTMDEYDKKNKDLIKYKKGETKHYGILIEKEPHQKDVCTCESFYFGNSDEYKKSHPEAFQCKHLHAARTLRYENYPEKTN